MSDERPQPEQPEGGTIPQEAIFQGYEQEIRVLTRRVIVAEASVRVLQQQNEIQRRMIESAAADQSPGEA